MAVCNIGSGRAKVDTSAMTPYEARFMGRISELLLDVWMEYNQVNYKELPCIQLEKRTGPRRLNLFWQRNLRTKSMDRVSDYL